MDDIDLSPLTIGNFIPDGAIVTVDTDGQHVVMTRNGEFMEVEIYVTDLEALFRINAEAAANFNASGKHGDLVRIASVPNHIHYEWDREGITKDDKALSRRLNDSDFSKFRTNSWRV